MQVTTLNPVVATMIATTKLQNVADSYISSSSVLLLQTKLSVKLLGEILHKQFFPEGSVRAQILLLLE
jgi:hypothetical protein